MISLHFMHIAIKNVNKQFFHAHLDTYFKLSVV